MTLDAYAKINLGLHVLRKRSDGYHDIETVMARIGWCDTIEAKPARDITMTSSDAGLPTGHENLCMKAAHALAKHYGAERGANLHLTKRIPVGAGLGGGSSDAASTLRLLVRLWELPAPVSDLSEIGGEIGADVPFFLGDSPALAEGIGERLTPLQTRDGTALSLPFTFVVVKPQYAVSTEAAYREAVPDESDRPNLPEVIESLDLARWRLELKNDFEESVATRLPEIREIKNAFYDAGAGFAAMSGSGSAVFGVFEDADRARRAASSFEVGDYVSWVGKAV